MVSLDRIKRILYELENLVDSFKDFFYKNNIDAIELRELLKYYLKNFKQLSKCKDKVLLDLLYENLLIIYNKDMSKLSVIAAINFLKKYKDTFFKQNHTNKSATKQLPKKIDFKYIDNINISNFFSIKNIELNGLKDKKEVYIVGENGDGKTLLLQAIAIGLKGTIEDSLKEFRKREKEFSIEIENKEDIKDWFFAYGSSRNSSCQIKEDKVGFLTLFSSEYDLYSPTEWLIELYNAQNANEELVISLQDAIRLLQKMLNRDIEIEVNYKSVKFLEKGSEVSFEQLSSGYKSVITIICDLIYRLSQIQQVSNISEFKAVVLIDEVELHLHLKWQYRFMQKLRDIFPNIQFIVTTHSATVILGSSIDAVYYSIFKENGETKISKQQSIKSQFINDIQLYIFGFDINKEILNSNLPNNNKQRQKEAKKAMLDLIDTIDKESK